jgi:hypothetical protein
VGEIGGNDYNYAFFKGKTLDDAKSYVPTVATAIIDATEVSRPDFFFLSRIQYLLLTRRSMQYSCISLSIS